MDATAITTFINESVTDMLETFTAMAPITETGNMTAALIDDNNITDSILFDENNTITSSYENNVTSTPNESMLPFAFTTVHYVLRALCASLTIFGNLLTIIAVSRFERLQNNTCYFICSLAVADLVTGSMTPIAIALHVIGIHHPHYLSLCLFHIFPTLLSILTNVSSIFWIAVDRYMFIAYPLHYPLFVTSTRTFLVIGFSWLFNTVQLAVMIAVGERPEIGMTCKYSIFLTKTMWNYIVMPEFVVVTLITSVLYTAISCIAYKHGKKIAALKQPYNTYEATTNRQQKRIAKMMIMVLGTFFICNIPTATVSILEWFFTDSLLMLVLEKITVIILWTNTWINPIIYAWKSKEFQLAFRKLLGLKGNNTRSVYILSPVANN